MIKTTIVEPTHKARQILNQQLAAFAASGGTIKIIPRGVTGLPPKFDNWVYQY